MIWVFTVNENSDGFESYKARYVAKGLSQVEGIDYKETFAPTANITSILSLMQRAAQLGLILHQMDVKPHILMPLLTVKFTWSKLKDLRFKGKRVG